MRFTINGKPAEASAEIQTPLLDLLRDHLGLIGAEKGCKQGASSASTVPVDVERINVCRALVVPSRDRDILTVEELAQKANRLNVAVRPLPVSKITSRFLENGSCKTRSSPLQETIRGASQPGLRSLLPRFETTSL
jgi:aerobic-type carbon monoxide dehydrogenase small subunit (CoxS/CutS family)